MCDIIVTATIKHKKELNDLGSLSSLEKILMSFLFIETHRKGRFIILWEKVISKVKMLKVRVRNRNDLEI